MKNNNRRVNRHRSDSKQNSPRKKIGFTFKSLALATMISASGVATSAWLWDTGDVGAEGTITVALQTAFQAIVEQATRVLSAFDAQMAMMDTAVSGAFQYEREQINSAMAVFTKQQSVSANLVAENAVKVAQNEVAVEQARLQKERILETNERLGSQGQGHKVCTVIAQGQEVTKAVSNNKKMTPQLIASTVYASSGSFGNPQKALEEMNLEHSANYCTPEQASSGFCDSVTDKAGWNLMTSTLFTPTTTDSEVYDAQNSLINNMIGLPDSTVPQSLKGSPSATNYLIAKQRKDAIISPAIHSLKSIQAEFVGLDSTHSDTKLSPMQAINSQIERYLGSGEEYMEWNRTLTSASEDGVMKELLKVNALELYLLARQYNQYEREELLVAGLVTATQQMIDKKNEKSGVARSPERERDLLSAREITSKATSKIFFGE